MRMNGCFTGSPIRLTALCLAALGWLAVTARSEPGVMELQDVANFSELARRSAVAPAAPANGGARNPRPRSSITPVHQRVVRQGPRLAPVSSRSVAAAAAAAAAPSGGANLVAASVPLASPPLSASFPALLDDGTEFRPDTSGAVGPNHLMVALNSSIRIMTRSGTTNSTITLDAFWAGLGAFNAFHPRVLYDPYGGRWIHTAVGALSTNNSGLLIAVSQTSDPTGNWNRYYIGISTNSPAYPSSPTPGFNKNWIAVLLIPATTLL